MLHIRIRKEELSSSKWLIKEFDRNKRYDKIRCSSNYIGILGEIVFDRYLTELGVKHTWVEVVKDSSNEPDFIINGVSIDLKTTRSDVMWFQKPRHDIYIYAHIEPNNEYLDIVGFATKEALLESIKSNISKKVTRGTRFDYIIEPDQLIPIELMEVLYAKT